MASLFSHIIVPCALKAIGKESAVSGRLLLLACFTAVLPDADVIAFKFGIPYESDFGHRGFSHSIVFALGLGMFCSVFSRWLKSSAAAVFIMVSLATLSHALLDALTNGGLGVALYWPVNSERFFFPWRPIQVSPIGVASFFSERGWRVIQSELVWIWLPLISASAVGLIIKKLLKRNTK